jgi:beta-glucanase (GH16 family)
MFSSQNFPVNWIRARFYWPAQLVLTVWCCLVGCSTAAVTPAYDYSTPLGLHGGAWVPTFADEFSAAALNASKWNVRTNESHCSPCELQLYVPSALNVSDGELVVTTARGRLIGPGGQLFNFSSGWVDTFGKFSQRYGLFEARATLPAQAATGAWPAFWTLPANRSICWPMGGEIDVFEYTANPLLNNVFGSYRWGTACGDDMQPLPGAPYPPWGAPEIDWSAAPHTFSVVWNETALAFFVDGALYETKTSAEVDMPLGEHYVILDTAVAWYYPPAPGAAYPTTTRWDWVHVFAWE